MKVCPTCDKTFATHLKLCEHDGSALQIQDPPDGHVLGERYRLVKKLGEGGMGVVFLAEHAKLGKKMAVKFLRGHLAEDPVILARFQREARAASEIDHSGIVDVLDFGEDADHGVYYVMEYVEGRELSDILEGGDAMPAAEVVRLGAALADTLYQAHKHGVVHRDLKPDNIFLWEREGRESVPKILDFGIATAPDGEGQQLTQTGAVFGTPPYMSPEQAGGESVGASSDLYTLGVILYQMATGSLPFGGGMLELLEAHRSQIPAPLSARNPDVPAALESVVLRCLAKRPEERFASMAELRDSLLHGEGVATSETVGVGPGGAGSLPSMASVPLAPSIPPESAGPRMSTTGLAHGEQIAAAEAAIDGGGGRGRTLALAAVVLIAGGVGAASYLTGGSPAPPAAKPDRAAAAPPAAKPAPKPKPWVRPLSSTPAAAVWEGDKELGKTPFDVELTDGQEARTFTLKLEGHADAEVVVDRSSRDPVDAKLEPVEAAGPPPPPEAAASKPKAKPKKKTGKKRKKKRKKRSGFGLDDF